MKQFKQSFPKRPDFVLMYRDMMGNTKYLEGMQVVPLFLHALNGTKDQTIDDWCLCGILYSSQLSKDGIVEGIAIPLCQSPAWHIEPEM